MNKQLYHKMIRNSSKLFKTISLSTMKASFLCLCPSNKIRSHFLTTEKQFSTGLKTLLTGSRWTNQNWKNASQQCKAILTDSNHVELAPTNEVKKETWYILVFPVTHPKKQKVRLVFDSSAKFQDTSLNDMLLSGPDLINRLKMVLIRFRKARVGFAAMFYCFVLDENLLVRW